MPRTRSTHPVVKLCEESPLPIYALDDQRRIVSCNRACLEWLGFTAQQLIGQRCDYVANETAAPEAVAAAALCPPPQAFLGETCTGQILWKNAAGEVVGRPATFVPVRVEEPAGVLVVLGDPRRVAVESSPVSLELATSETLHQRLQQLVQRMRTRFRLDQLVGDSSAMRRVRDQVATAITSRARVVIQGPTGSGREHVARTIAYGEKGDVDRAVLPLACGTLDIDLLDASIAAATRRGVGPSIDPVWLLLDVDQLSSDLQVEIAVRLRAQGNKLSVLSTARHSLIDLAATGSFDRDLAFMLSTLVIELPALRERREDIPLLIQRMVEEYNTTAGRQLAGFSPAAMDRLASLPWTGNVEELATVVREACQAVSTVWIGEADLPRRVRTIVSAGMHPRRELEPIQLDDFLLEVERELIERAMRRANGNKAQAARLLGVSRARLLRRLEQLGLVTRPETTIDFRPEVDEGSQPTPLESQLLKEE